MRYIVTVFFLILFTTSIQSQAQETIFENAIAYVGEDNNIYLTDFENTLAITDDAYGTRDEPTDYLVYENPTWSADGQSLVFLAVTLDGRFSQSIVLVKSGESPQVIFSDDSATVRINERHLALSPDGSEIAFFGYNTEEGSEQGVYKLSVDDGSVQFLVRSVSSGIGEPSPIDPARNLSIRASGQSFYRDQFALRWGQYGILYTPTFDSIAGLRLLSADGDPLWTTEGLYSYLLSEQGDYALGERDAAWYEIDMQTGTANPLNLPEGAKPIGWIGGQLYYRSQSDVISVPTNADMIAGFEIYDWFWGGFTATSATNTIYAYAPDIGDVKIAEIQAHDIAFVSGIDINTMLLRYVRSSVPAVLALNEGATAEDVAHLTAHTEYVLVRLAYKEEGVNTFFRNRIVTEDAVYGRGEFVVIN